VEGGVGGGWGGWAVRTLLGLLVVERLVGEGRGVQHRVVGVHLAARLEQSLPRDDVALDHALVDEGDTQGLRDEQVDLAGRREQAWALA